MMSGKGYLRSYTNSIEIFSHLLAIQYFGYWKENLFANQNI